MTLKIAFDIGGVLSKYPDQFRTRAAHHFAKPMPISKRATLAIVRLAVIAEKTGLNAIAAELRPAMTAPTNVLFAVS